MSLPTHRVPLSRSVPFALVGGLISAVPNILLSVVGGPFAVTIQGQPTQVLGAGMILAASVVPAVPGALIYSGLRHYGFDDLRFFALAAGACAASMAGPWSVSDDVVVRGGLAVMHAVSALCITAGLISAGRG